jgi:hypothetical protein
MSSYSSIDTRLVLEALEPYDFSGISHLCDVGGGHGYTLCSLLGKYPHLQGTVLELPNVIAKQELLWADKMGVGGRCTYVSGDMFRAVPQRTPTWCSASCMTGTTRGVARFSPPCTGLRPRMAGC